MCCPYDDFLVTVCLTILGRSAILQDFGPSNPNDEARRVQPDSSANGTSCSRLAGESEALHDDSMRAETRFLDPDDVWSQICAAVKPRGECFTRPDEVQQSLIYLQGRPRRRRIHYAPGRAQV